MANPLRKVNILAEDLDQEIILYDPDAGAVHILNSTARAIWDLCDGLHDVVAMEQALRASFTVPPEYDLGADIQRTLAELVHLGLLT